MSDDPLYHGLDDDCPHCAAVLADQYREQRAEEEKDLEREEWRIES